MSHLGWAGALVLGVVLLAMLTDKLSWLGYGLAGIAGLVVLFYLGFPLVLKNMMSLNLDAPAEDIDSTELPDHIADYFERVGRSLESVGFFDIGTFRLDGMIPNIYTSFRLMAHGEHHTLAMVTWIQTFVNSEPQPDQTYLEFATELTDGRNLNTNDGKDLPSADQSPEKVLYVFPGIDDPALMWAIHRGMVDEESGGKPTRPFPMDLPPAELFRQEFRKELEEKVRRGYWAQGEHEGLYRPTSKGAYLMAWAELPPFKPWRMRRALRQASALRKRLGL